MKKMRCILLLAFVCVAVSCFGAKSLINPAGMTIEKRFTPPSGFSRTAVQDASFGKYLRSLKLKQADALVLRYDGSVKDADGIYCAVVDLSLGKKNLQQCADAVMRLRAEYLFKMKRYDEIAFTFLHDGRRRRYNAYARNDHSYATFMNYMEYVFESANTASLFNDTKAVDLADMRPGDIFLQKKNPYGHAVMIVDMAVNECGEKIFLLAQSYMPAQDIQVLVNPDDGGLSPWYHMPDGGKIETPEWDFTLKDLRRFK